MKNPNTETSPQKSTLLLVLALFFLFNSVQLFRTSIRTLYFTVDTSSDYVLVQATVTESRHVATDETKDSTRITPFFTFLYNEETVRMEAPKLSFQLSEHKVQPYIQGQEYPLWVHKQWGELILPPAMGQNELGRSQMFISAIFMLLTVVTWLLRNKLAEKTST